jgi:hypothetical protein
MRKKRTTILYIQPKTLDLVRWTRHRQSFKARLCSEGKRCSNGASETPLTSSERPAIDQLLAAGRLERGELTNSHGLTAVVFSTYGYEIEQGENRISNSRRITEAFVHRNGARLNPRRHWIIPSRRKRKDLSHSPTAGRTTEQLSHSM